MSAWFIESHSRLSSGAAAVQEYESFRKNVREIRKAYPPLNRAERKVFKGYEAAVFEIGQELKRGLGIRVSRLNEKLDSARSAMADYFRVKQFGE